MKNKNLDRISNLSQTILNAMISFESKENKGVVYVPKSMLDAWQRELFSILKDEVDH